MEYPRCHFGKLARAAASSLIHDDAAVHDAGAASSGTAIYTLADPRDVRAPRYVGQTRDPRRRFAQHVLTARLWLPDEAPWWVRSPSYRPLYAWLRELHRDGGRLPFMWVVEWVDDRSARSAERAAIVRLLAQGAALLNAEARLSGAQLPLL